MLKKSVLKSIIFLVVMILPELLMAQGLLEDPNDVSIAGGTGVTGGTGSGITYSGGTSSRNDVPLDGGLSLLLAAGIGYGVKRARSKSKTPIV
jgi:hypothetical protein